MRLRFREDKTTQAVARLLKLRGGKMNHLKLVKLVYLADRKALVTWGRPITFDWYVSMDHGPVPSFTLDKINSPPNPHRPSYWHQYISERQGNEICLIAEPPNDQLSPAEEQLLDSIFEEFGHMWRWDIVKYCHKLPEWQDPKGSRLPINIRDILLAEGMSEDEVRDVADILQGESEAVRLMG